MRHVKASQLIKVFQCHTAELGLQLIGQFFFNWMVHQICQESEKKKKKLYVPRSYAQMILIDEIMGRV